MTWTLKSGREMPGDDACTHWLQPGGAQRQVWSGGCSCCGEDMSKPETLTPDERREIADAVIAAWNRWAETGEP